MEGTINIRKSQAYQMQVGPNSQLSKWLATVISMHSLKGVFNSAWFSLTFFFFSLFFSYFPCISALPMVPRHSQFQQNYANSKTNKLVSLKTAFEDKRCLQRCSSTFPKNSLENLICFHTSRLSRKIPNFTCCHVLFCLTHGCFYLESKYRKALPASNRGRIIPPHKKSNVSQALEDRKSVV